ncbi:hypothetical protein BOX15_Mlig030629g1 [Macrostomum lignano]|uniref:Selenoprotein T n=1 Tax=Macrostomum lignano TaxID=282301 RepID=A0A267EAX7_9PLAT|nr:hypothetical protein BOX15_Mlig030629g1 [Macrostomum lignano]
MEGDNYPPPAWRQLLCTVLSWTKLGLIMAIVMGVDPFPYLGLQTPQMYQWASQNRMYACMMLFFISNVVEGQLISTGAFEVTFNGMSVWSKLQNGRVPSIGELMGIIDSHMMSVNTATDPPQL